MAEIHNNSRILNKLAFSNQIILSLQKETLIHCFLFSGMPPQEQQLPISKGMLQITKQVRHPRTT